MNLTRVGIYMDCQRTRRFGQPTVPLDFCSSFTQKHTCRHRH